jgi:hypothetical protein
MKPVTYNLELNQNEEDFYSVLSDFTSHYLQARARNSIADVKRYIAYHRPSSKYKESFDEYFLQYLTIGVFINKYSSNAISSGWMSMKLLSRLYDTRNRIGWLKSLTDGVRGVLTTLLLKGKSEERIDSARSFSRLLKWLAATGEFTEEAERLEGWYGYLNGMPLSAQKVLLRNCVEAASDFELEAKLQLGVYTENVDEFRASQLSGHRFKENYIFCGKHEVEYHLNMFGAEIINRAMNSQFQRTKRKVILLPTCMSKPAGKKCMARMEGTKLVCTGCSPDCNVNEKRWEFSAHNVEVVLIPHSSDFTRHLTYWKNQTDTGLVGIACVLNLMKGGYELQKLNIPSQCVYLDYCGCKKHWHKEGVPTNLDGKQLTKILG